MLPSLEKIARFALIQARIERRRRKLRIGPGQRSIIKSQCYQDRGVQYPYNSTKRDGAW